MTGLDLRRAIERLLDDVSRGPLGALAPLGPLPGGLGIAEGAARAVPGPAPGVLIEPGVLCLSGLVADVPMPYAPTRPTRLETWASGAGVTVPGSSPVRTTHLLGLQRPAAALTPAVEWVDEDLTGQVYSTAAKLDAVCDSGTTRVLYPPHAYRGGAMLAAEACLARGRLLSDMLPAGFGAGYGLLGIGWSPAGAIWAFNVSASVGLIARRLRVQASAAQNHTWWTSGAFSADAAHLNLLRVMAALEPDPAAATLTILTSGEVAPCYADGAAPLWGGWQWTWQSTLSSPLSAYWTGCWGPLSDGRRRARSCRIDITWSGGTPSATVTVGPDAAWGNPGVCPLRIPAAAGQPLPASAEGTADVVVYTTTTPGGAVHLVRQAARSGGSWTGRQDRFPWLPGDATWTGAQESGTRLALAGWQITGAVSASATTVGWASASLAVLRTWPTSQRTITGEPIGGCKPYVSWHDACTLDGQRWTGSGSAPGGSVAMDVANRSSESAYSDRGGGAWAACAAITATGGIAVGERQSWSPYTESVDTFSAYDVPVESRWAGGTHRWLHGPGGRASLADCQGNFFSYLTAYLDWGHHGWYSRSVPAGYEYRRLWLAGSDGHLRVLDASAWGALWSPTGEAAVPDCRASYRPSSAWTTAPGTWTSDAGLSPAQAAVVQGWAGG